MPRGIIAAMHANPAAIAAVRRSNQQYFEQVSRRETIGCGYAYVNVEHPRVPACNFLGEFLLDAADPDLLGTVAGFFSNQGATCFGYVPAAQQDVAPVEQLLSPRGFQRRDIIASILPATADPGAPATNAASPGHPHFVGARAMRRAYLRLIAERSATGDEPDETALTQIHGERLNDPQYDAFVAFDPGGDEPIGTVTVYQVGEIGRICDLYVARGRRRQNVGRALLAHAAQTARRWALRPICAAVSAKNTAGRALLGAAGFEEGGVIAEFWRSDVRDPEVEC